jgi:hypothetical protein
VRLRDAAAMMPRGGEVAGQRHRLGVPAPRARPGQPLTTAASLECPVRQAAACRPS